MGQKDPIKSRKRMSLEERQSRPLFEPRISQAAQDLEEQAWLMPPGPERDALLRRARALNTEEHLRDWVSSRPPSLQSQE
jgi:hypothetical protein